MCACVCACNRMSHREQTALVKPVHFFMARNRVPKSRFKGILLVFWYISSYLSGFYIYIYILYIYIYIYIYCFAHFNTVTIFLTFCFSVIPKYMVILRKTVVLLETWFRTLAYSSIASSFYRYAVSIFTLIISYEIQIYNPN